MLNFVILIAAINMDGCIIYLDRVQYCICYDSYVQAWNNNGDKHSDLCMQNFSI